MGEPSRFLSSFFKKQTGGGNRKFKLLEGHKKQARIRNPVDLPEEINLQFTLDEIRAATYNFNEDLIIRRGSWVTVYKGFFNDGNLVVAIRRLINPDSEQGCKEFRTELLLLSQLHHQNLLPLIGFCYDEGEMILVYQYMRNGTLRYHLYGSGYDPLPWKQRLEICIGAARALHYLHIGAKGAIIHRDVKSGNILLDENWGCKLSDFGLSKLRPRSTLKTLEKIDSAVMGSLGYLDPEYFLEGKLTEKCDVYSFGVVLFEVLCARAPFDALLNINEVNLAEWTHESILKGTIYDIIDPYLKGKIAPECFKLFVDIAYSCTSVKGESRPDMGEVELMLEHALELQEKADSDMAHLAPCGESNMYE